MLGTEPVATDQSLPHSPTRGSSLTLSVTLVIELQSKVVQLSSVHVTSMGSLSESEDSEVCWESQRWHHLPSEPEAEAQAGWGGGGG